MKGKHFLKVTAILISLAIVLTFGLTSTTKAQITTTVGTEHYVDVDSKYQFFSMECRPTTYFEIKFDIKEVQIL